MKVKTAKNLKDYFINELPKDIEKPQVFLSEDGWELYWKDKDMEIQLDTTGFYGYKYKIDGDWEHGYASNGYSKGNFPEELREILEQVLGKN